MYLSSRLWGITPQSLSEPEVSAQPALDEPPIGKRWGEFPPVERQAALRKRIKAWEQEQDHGNRPGPFAGTTHYTGFNLTGADVYWLAALTVGAEDMRAGKKALDGILYEELSSLHLEGANLTGAKLNSANLTRAQLNDAILTGAQLNGARLFFAHLKSANLEEAHLEGTDLVGVDLERANLDRVQLKGANLTGAQLKEAYLRGAHLEGADLHGAHLEGTYPRIAQRGCSR